jgi:hypothetical protein
MSFQLRVNGVSEPNGWQCHIVDGVSTICQIGKERAATFALVVDPVGDGGEGVGPGHQRERREIWRHRGQHDADRRRKGSAVMIEDQEGRVAPVGDGWGSAVLTGDGGDGVASETDLRRWCWSDWRWCWSDWRW